MEGYPTDISTTCLESNTLIDNSTMVCKETSLRHECMADGGIDYSETLRVLGKIEHAGSKIAVQCAAVLRTFEERNSSCNSYFTYSRFALLSCKNYSKKK